MAPSETLRLKWLALCGLWLLPLTSSWSPNFASPLLLRRLHMHASFYEPPIPVTSFAESENWVDYGLPDWLVSRALELGFEKPSICQVTTHKNAIDSLVLDYFYQP